MCRLQGPNSQGGRNRRLLASQSPGTRVRQAAGDCAGMPACSRCRHCFLGQFSFRSSRRRVEPSPQHPPAPPPAAVPSSAGVYTMFSLGRAGSVVCDVWSESMGTWDTPSGGTKYGEATATQGRARGAVDMTPVTVSAAVAFG